MVELDMSVLNEREIKVYRELALSVKFNLLPMSCLVELNRQYAEMIRNRKQYEVK